MNNVQRFYEEVNRIQKVTAAEIMAGKHPGQPEPLEVYDEQTAEFQNVVEFVWAASLRNLNYGTSAADPGRGKGLCLAPLKLFATRAAEGTHRLATKEEIERYKEVKRQRRIEYEQSDLARNNRFEIQLPKGS